uniref:Protein FAR1-RELATED SEQUENCE n=1 Tax=Lactuca sativa TaxID=4236 RepID=A0A9R1WRC1_LACSA|nr:hypothetical protein LSAT_V11C100041160 [Lactuca sativa]
MEKTYWIPDVDMKPYKGQTFPTFEDGLTFYKDYARKSGFETRIRSTMTVKGVKGYTRRYIIKKFLDSKRRLTFSQKQIIYDMSNVNMGPSVAYKYMKESKIKFIGERDADFVIDKLKKKKDYLQEYSFDYSVGSNGELTRLFWADKEAK